MQHATIGNNHIIFRIFSRNDPKATDYFDANWLSAEVAFENQNFSGQITCDLFANDFPGFVSQLVNLQHNLNGTAEFSTIEGQVYIKMSGNGLGAIQVNAFLQNVPDNRLEIAFEIDQTYLENIIKDFKNLAAAFPVLHNPSEP